MTIFYGSTNFDVTPPASNGYFGLGPLLEIFAPPRGDCSLKEISFFSSAGSAATPFLTLFRPSTVGIPNRKILFVDENKNFSKSYFATSWIIVPVTPALNPTIFRNGNAIRFQASTTRFYTIFSFPKGIKILQGNSMVLSIISGGVPVAAQCSSNIDIEE